MRFLLLSVGKGLRIVRVPSVIGYKDKVIICIEIKHRIIYQFCSNCQNKMLISCFSKSNKSYIKTTGCLFIVELSSAFLVSHFKIGLVRRRKTYFINNFYLLILFSLINIPPSVLAPMFVKPFIKQQNFLSLKINFSGSNVEIVLNLTQF